MMLGNGGSNFLLDSCGNLRASARSHQNLFSVLLSSSTMIIRRFLCLHHSLPSSCTTTRRRSRGGLTATAEDGTAAEESFTAAVAYQPDRLVARTVPGLATTAAEDVWIRQPLAVLMFGIGVAIGAAVVLVLLPSLWLAKTPQQQDTAQQDKDGASSEKNRSVSSGGSRTAILALYARSQSYLQGSGGPDHLAPRFLDRVSLQLGGPRHQVVWGEARLLRFCAFLSRLNFRFTHRIFEDQVARIATLFRAGFVSPMQVRTCWLDDCVEAFVQRHCDSCLDNTKAAAQERASSGSNSTNKGVVLANLVILGSGFDSRCYRLPLGERGVRTFEVDAPGTQAEKQRVLREAGIDASSTAFVPCDFETQDWLQCLTSTSQFDSSLPTLFLFEGVTMYLGRPAIMETLQRVARGGQISSSGNGNKSLWYIAFDYLDSSWAMSGTWRRAMKRVGEPFKFAMSGSEPEELVHSCDLQLLEHLSDKDELSRRYLPVRFKDKPVGFLGDYGGFVLAATRV